jgi:hypothetical protein
MTTQPRASGRRHLGREVSPLEQNAKYGVPGVCEHIPRRVVITFDQATDFHDLHCARQNPDCRVIDVSRDAKQDHAFPRREAVGDAFRSRWL